MKKVILKVQDKKKVLKLGEFCTILYVSKFMNTVGIEIKDEDLYRLDKDTNIISYHESEEGTFQLSTVI